MKKIIGVVLVAVMLIVSCAGFTYYSNDTADENLEDELETFLNEYFEESEDHEYEDIELSLRYAGDDEYYYGLTAWDNINNEFYTETGVLTTEDIEYVMSQS